MLEVVDRINRAKRKLESVNLRDFFRYARETWRIKKKGKKEKVKLNLWFQLETNLMWKRFFFEVFLRRIDVN